MFGFGKAKREATQVGEAAARMAIMPFWDMFERGFDARIWSDPYVLGLINGSVGAQTLSITGRKLSTTDKGFVVLGVLRSLGASQSAIEHFLRLAQTQDPEFARGSDDAILTFLLMAGAVKKEAYLEPDIVAAKEAVQQLREDASLLGITQDPRHPDEELGSAYIFLKAHQHKEAHYPRE